MDEFHKNSHAGDGKSGTCKVCMNEYARAHRRSPAFHTETAKRKRSEYYRANKERIARREAARHLEAPHVRRNQVLRKKFGIGVQ